MDSPKVVKSERSPLLHSNRPLVYSSSLSQEEAILSISRSKYTLKYRLYRKRWYVLLVLFVLNASNAMVS